MSTVIFRPAGLKCALGGLDKAGERVRIADGQLGKHFSVQLDAALLQAVHETGIVDAVHFSGRADTRNPEFSEISFS